MTDRDEATGDPIAEDIASRDPRTDDQVPGEQVLADDPSAEEPRVAPEPDDLAHRGPKHRADESDHDRPHQHD
jgi:hypothetical protein